MISPIFDDLNTEYDGKAVLAKVGDEAADIAQDCGISAMQLLELGARVGLLVPTTD